MHGVIATRDAISMAQEAGLDLVEISPTAAPPVAKILDYGKYKIRGPEAQDEARKKQKVIEVKEIKMRPGIDIHDYEVKMRSVHRFLEEGDKVKVTMRFRGREMVHQEIGHEGAGQGAHRSRRGGQGGIPPAARRPPDGHGGGAQMSATNA